SGPPVNYTFQGINRRPSGSRFWQIAVVCYRRGGMSTNYRRVLLRGQRRPRHVFFLLSPLVSALENNRSCRNSSRRTHNRQQGTTWDERKKVTPHLQS